MNETFFFHSSRVGEEESAVRRERRRSGSRVARRADGQQKKSTLDELANGARGAGIGPQSREIGEADVLVEVMALHASRRRSRAANDHVVPSAQNAELARVVAIGERDGTLRRQDLGDGREGGRLVRILDVDQDDGHVVEQRRGAGLHGAAQLNRAHHDALANALVRGRTLRHGVEQHHAVGNSGVGVKVQSKGSSVNGLALRRRNGTRLRAAEATKRNCGRDRHGTATCLAASASNSNSLSSSNSSDSGHVDLFLGETRRHDSVEGVGKKEVWQVCQFFLRKKKENSTGFIRPPL